MKLFTALEDEQLVEPVTESRQRIQALEEELSDHEVNAAYADADANRTISNNAEADVGTLTKVNDILTEDTESNKVLTKDVLQMSRVVTESICSRLGYKATDRLFISTEDLGTSTKYQEAISMESFGEVIKRTWEAIIRFFKRIAEGIKNLWNKLFSRNKITKRRNEQNENIIQEMKTNTAYAKPRSFEMNAELQKIETIDFLTSRNYFILTRKVDRNGNPDQNRDDLYDIMLNAVNTASSFAEDFMETINSILDAIDRTSKETDVDGIRVRTNYHLQTHIFIPKHRFQNMGLNLLISEDEGKPYKSWSLYSYRDAKPIITQNTYLCSLMDIKKLEKLQEINNRLENILEKFYGNDSIVRSKISKVMKDADKVLFAIDDSFDKDRIDAINNLNNVLRQYATLIPTTCSDICTNVSVYISKNLEAIKHNRKETVA